MQDGEYVTIQRTAKRWKALAALGTIVVGLGILQLIGESFDTGFATIIVGIFIQGMARGGAWWTNG